MKLLHSIGPVKHTSNYNTREEVEACTEPLSFDGVYKSVWENRDILKDKEVMLFIMGNYVGQNNAFDTGEPLQLFCDWRHITELATAYNCELGWHTWSHPDLTTLTDVRLAYEVTPPWPMDFFAYPYGRYDDRVVEAVKKAGFKFAWSVTQGNDDRYTLKREYL